MPERIVPSQSEREYQRFHLLSTVVAYPSMSTADVCDRANNECQHDLFDPLPMMDPRAAGPKLKALEREGWVTGWVDFDGVRWDPTDEGKLAWALYEAGLDV